ncbi:flagellar biosynthesis protein FlhB [Paraburkholderia sp. IW21]|uniref:EscU/YscU/HrcU family type III secretion system export apparatus switch protein n=1 Tax=Paraburkholderia sp. IW21 TaxID=3242488 RepID=UPI0035200E0C
MSELDQNKSEQATAYKLEQARRKGIVPRSQEASILVSLACCGGYLWARGDRMAAHFAALSARALNDAAYLSIGSHAMLTWLGSLIVQSVRIVAPLVGVSAGGALLATVLQTGLLFAPAALKADFSRLNPAQGFKRIFSTPTLIEAAKACLKMVIYSGIAWSCIADTVVTVEHAALPSESLPKVLADSTLHLLFSLLMAALVFAAIDHVITRRAFAKKMRMSRHDIKQEHKQREGDPRIKQRRRQLQRELLQRATSMRNVRGADVLLTNPTHYAIGLKYEPGSMAAPAVVARGRGDFAQRLKRMAFIYGVPVIESRALARRLFRDAAFEREIPEHLFRDAAAAYLRANRAPSQRSAV